MTVFSHPLIRRIEVRDFKAVAEMTNRHFPHMNMTPSKISERLSKGFSYFVAVVDRIIVGFVDVKITEKYAKLMGLAVEEKFRGSGVGSALLDKAIEFAIARGKNAIYLKVKQSNLPAIKVYERRGFVFSKELDKNGESTYILSRKLET